MPNDPPSSPVPDADKEGLWAALVPELLVTDLERSIAFYCDLCGFRVRYARPEDGFAYLEQGGAQVMLEALSEDSWLTGPLAPPFGRGINLQIEVAEIGPLHDRLLEAGAVIFRPLQTDWYREGDIEHGQAQVMVQDPDGYLLRFIQPLGERPAQSGA
jgi:catechol 2,3-dioxygenase-like lactoylglutathione lyase family enzyme